MNVADALDFVLDFTRVFLADLALASPILVILMLVVAILGQVIARAEGWSLPDGLYQAFINATTVGYGDFHPTTGLSRLLAVAIALHAADHAFGIVSGPAGIAGQAT